MTDEEKIIEATRKQAKQEERERILKIIDNIPDKKKYEKKWDFSAYDVHLILEELKQEIENGSQ